MLHIPRAKFTGRDRNHFPLSAATSPLSSESSSSRLGLLFYLFADGQLVSEDTLYINFGYCRTTGRFPALLNPFSTASSLVAVWFRHSERIPGRLDSGQRRWSCLLARSTTRGRNKTCNELFQGASWSIRRNAIVRMISYQLDTGASLS